MSMVQAFADALLRPDAPCPPGLRVWNGSDPARRFAVHRNNVVVSLVDALADSHPVTQALVGEDFFRAMAAEFVRANPPRTPVLAWYGAGFADFVAHFPPAAGLPYLADLAQLEWLRVEAWHAADADPLPLAEIAAVLADEETLPGLRLSLHPALRVLRSAHPVVSLWAAHQSEDVAAALGAIDITAAEAALLVRDGLEVAILRIAPGAADFIARLQRGAALGEAAQATAPFDLAATLGLLLRSGAVVAITSSAKTA